MNRGFTLLELLSVMTIMGVIAAVSIPAVTALTTSNKVGQTTTELAGLLEQARQYAVAKNTYVWVVFNEQVEDNIDVLHVAVVASKDGTDPAVYGTVPSTGFDLVSKVRAFPHFKLRDAGAFSSIEVASLPSTPVITVANALSTTVAFDIKIPGNAATDSFAKTIRFSPSGEAKKSSYPIDVIEFGLQPSKNTSTPDPYNVAVMRVNGLTGQAFVYRR